jgi:NAD(P)-dependent dehydrogenase (short-subunit alcohol dehydrogenase family)
MGRFKDDVAIVTGAAQGIGAAYARALAAEGAKVIIADILDGSELADEITASGGTAIAMTIDVTDANSIQSMVEDTLSRFGKIDILINNAALFANLGNNKFDDIPDDEWNNVMNVNVRGVWQVSKAVVPAMRERQDRQYSLDHGAQRDADDAALRLVKGRRAGHDQGDGARSRR